MTTPGEFNHIEIPADDVDRATRFYGEVFGWSFAEAEGFEDYFLYRSGPGDLGGAVGRRGGEGMPHQVRTYVTVASIDEALEKVERLGGTTVVARSEVPGQGFYGVFRDTEGNEFGVWENPPA